MRSPLFQSTAGHWFRLTLQGTLVPAVESDIARERARLAEAHPMGGDQGLSGDWTQPLEAAR